MSMFDLFSKRQRRLRGEVPDVYVYDELPDTFRVQAVHVIRDLLGSPYLDRFHGASNREAWDIYRTIADGLSREYGLFRLDGERYGSRSYPEEVLNFLLAVENFERALDVIELCARTADLCTRKYGYMKISNFDEHVDTGLRELNARFREHGIGYQYEEGELLRIDSDLIHSKAVKPALTLLRSKGFEGPCEEFLRAHEHYRHERYEEALTDALKAFESTMKAICDRRGWIYEEKATARKLVDVCLSNGLIEEFWQSHLNGLRATLESSVATARNKLGGHGTGSSPREVPGELVGYVLHMTASTIVFFIERARK